MRLAHALFFLLTAAYCLLTFSAFAFQQFIRPRMVAALTGFVAWHAVWTWLALAVVAATTPWRSPRPLARRLGGAYVLTLLALATIESRWPFLPLVENTGPGLWQAALWLLPPLWLAWADHAATDPVPVAHPIPLPRLWRAVVLAALCVWLGMTLSAPARWQSLGEITLTAGGVSFGAVVSAVVHGLLALGLGATVVLVLVVARRRGTTPNPTTRTTPTDAIALRVLAVGAVTVGVQSLLFGGLSFHGAFAWALAALCAVMAVSVWSSLVRWLPPAQGAIDALDTWCRPLTGSAARPWGAWTGLVLVPVGLTLAVRSVARLDWNFLVQDLCIVATWVVTLAWSWRVTRGRAAGTAADTAPATAPVTTPARVVATAAAVLLPAVCLGIAILSHAEPLAARWWSARGFVPEFVLDGYATLDPSYRLVRRLTVAEPPGASAFYQLLREHSLVDKRGLTPVPFTFATPSAPAPVRPPHIFLIVIDSLRRDYLSPYNPRVTFTPQLATFAAESDTFQRAFTRYGGTGLSMPALWAGSLVPHTEYVLPFRPTNALGALLDANGYQQMMSLDHITADLFAPGRRLQALNAGQDEMQFRACTTLQEVSARIDAGAGRAAPLFVQMRTLDLHISSLSDRSQASNPAYGGFHPAAADRVARIDACIGQFLERLKTQGLYDNSLVVVTSDHGDALGEVQRWGHAYTLFPEIIRVPLLVHVPARLRAAWTTDTEAAVFSTDLVPSLYALLGYPVREDDPLAGRPFYVRPGTDTSWRRRAAVVLASSYGPVYGVLRNNGTDLFIADAVNGRDYAYDLRDLTPRRVAVTPDERGGGREWIQGALSELGIRHGRGNRLSRLQ